MLLRATGEMELLEKGGLLLGVMKGMPYESETVALHPGDVVVMFTDGVTEAMSPDGEEYEEHRLEALLREVRGGSAQEILDAINQAITVWSDGEPTKADDVTIIVMKVQ
jgi:sigma-B regulation protein RsbU (phosphoserine phosphatase)